MREDSRLDRLLKDIFINLETHRGSPSYETLPIYDLQVRSLVNLEHRKEAVELLERILKIRETMLAESHLDRLTSQYELAYAYFTK